MVQTYVLHWYFSDSNISYLTEYLMSKIYEYDKRNFERNLKELVAVQIGLLILIDETLSIICHKQMFDINRF